MWLIGLLAFLPGLALGLLGGGGSILVTPLLLAFGGTGVAEAVAASLAVVGTTAATGALRHARAGRVRLRAGLSFGLASMVGAYLGGRAASLLPPRLLMGLFAGMMLVTALAMLRRRDAVEATEPRPLRLASIGLVVGSVTGLVGAGGGFLVVPALMLFGGLAMRDAIGTSLFVIALQAGAGLLGQLSHVHLPLALVLTTSGGALAGMLVGAHFSHRISGEGLRRAFALFILVLSVDMFRRAGGLPLASGAAVLAVVGAGTLLLRELGRRPEPRLYPSVGGSK